MNCPNCSFELENTNICPNCGIDILLVYKISKISNRLYNKGLEQVNINDLSGAISSLNKSISFNKGNINARNLLGLIYFEIGHIGDAFKQWVLSSNIRKEDNFANEYIDDLRQSMRSFEKYNDSIKMYNQAIIYLKQKSDDMAIIQLKKAVDINPKFIDAHNLLSLCYLMQNNKNKAVESINKVLSIDISNQIALNYYKEIYPDNKRIDNKQVKNVSKESIMPRIDRNISKQDFGARNKGIMGFVAFVIGCICTFAVMYILVMPGAIDVKQQEIDRINASYTEVQNKYNELKTQSEETISSLQKENNDYKTQLDEINKQADIKDRTDKVLNASSLDRSGKSVEAAEILTNLDVTGLDEETINTFNELKEKVIPKAAKDLYNQGRNAFSNRKYDDGKNLLNKCVLYAQDDLTKYNALYYLGRIAMAEEDNTKAKEYLQQVEQNHPYTSIKRNASNYLKNLD